MLNSQFWLMIHKTHALGGQLSMLHSETDALWQEVSKLFLQWDFLYKHPNQMALNSSHLKENVSWQNLTDPAIEEGLKTIKTKFKISNPFKVWMIFSDSSPREFTEHIQLRH